MRILLGAAGALLLSAAAAGEAPAPPALQPGRTVRLAEKQPEGKLAGCVLSNHRGQRVFLLVEAASGGDRAAAGRMLMVSSRGAGRRDEGRQPPPPDPDREVLAQLGPGDRVEIEWYAEEKDTRAATVKLLTAFPRKGRLAGKVLVCSDHSDFLRLEVAKAPAGGEHLEGKAVRLDAARVRNPNQDKEGKQPPWVTAPEQAKAIAELGPGDLVEADYHAEGGRFRLEAVRKTGRAPEEPKPEGRQERPAPPKKDDGDPEPL